MLLQSTAVHASEPAPLLCFWWQFRAFKLSSSAVILAVQASVYAYESKRNASPRAAKTHGQDTDFLDGALLVADGGARAHLKSDGHRRHRRAGDAGETEEGRQQDQDRSAGEAFATISAREATGRYLHGSPHAAAAYHSPCPAKRVPPTTSRTRSSLAVQRSLTRYHKSIHDPKFGRLRFGGTKGTTAHTRSSQNAHRALHQSTATVPERHRPLLASPKTVVTGTNTPLAPQTVPYECRTNPTTQ